MVIGSAAFFVYGATCIATVRNERMPVWLGATLAWTAWAAVAFAGWAVLWLSGAIA
jgi:hypothetical protein